MYISNSLVKKTALFSLKNKYTSGIIAACIYFFAVVSVMACVSLAAVVSAEVAVVLMLICFFLFILPLTFGYIYLGTSVILSGESEPLLIFKYFTSKKDYIKSLKMSFAIGGNAFFYFTLLYLPAVFTDLLSSGKLSEVFGVQVPIWASNLSPVADILSIASVVITILLMLKYYLAPFLMAADETMDPIKAINLSRVISTRSKWSFVKLAFSFFLYIIACFFVIPIVFILPYFNAAYNVHCRFAVAIYNKAIDEANSRRVPNFNANITF